MQPTDADAGLADQALTVPQLKARLTSLGVSFASKDRKERLTQLLADKRASDRSADAAKAHYDPPPALCESLRLFQVPPHVRFLVLWFETAPQHVELAYTSSPPDHGAMRHHLAAFQTALSSESLPVRTVPAQLTAGLPGFDQAGYEALWEEFNGISEADLIRHCGNEEVLGDGAERPRAVVEAIWMRLHEGVLCENVRIALHQQMQHAAFKSGEPGFKFVEEWPRTDLLWNNVVGVVLSQHSLGVPSSFSVSDLYALLKDGKRSHHSVPCFSICLQMI